VLGGAEVAASEAELEGGVEPSGSVATLESRLSLQLIIDSATTPIRRALRVRIHWGRGIAHLRHFDSMHR
jgi:hypothetical protein